MSVERSPDGAAAAVAPAVTFASAYRRRESVARPADARSSAPGRAAVVLAALLVGLLLMGMQLWLLTVALDLYLAGQGRQIWLLALVSGAIFVGGVVMLVVLGRRPRLGGRRSGSEVS
ncbi:MAG: DUF6755 family protein [Chloroflexota bacterium]